MREISHAPSAGARENAPPKTEKRGLLARKIRLIPRRTRRMISYAAIIAAVGMAVVSASFNAFYASSMGDTSLKAGLYVLMAVVVSVALAILSLSLTVFRDMSLMEKLGVHSGRALALALSCMLGIGFVATSKDTAVGTAETQIAKRNQAVSLGNQISGAQTTTTPTHAPAKGKAQKGGVR